MARGDQLSRQWKIIQSLIASRIGKSAAEGAGVDEIKHWIMGWGANATMLEPQSLRDAIKREAKRMLQGYQDLAVSSSTCSHHGRHPFARPAFTIVTTNHRANKSRNSENSRNPLDAGFFVCGSKNGPANPAVTRGKPVHEKWTGCTAKPLR